MTRTERNQGMSAEAKSRIGEDLLGSGLVDSVDGSSPDESPVVQDVVSGRAAGGPTRAVGDDPVDLEGVANDPSLTVDDGPGHDPLHHDLIHVVPDGDRESPGVLGSDRVDAVDDVGSDDPGTLGELSTGKTATSDEGDSGEQERSMHGEESKSGLRPVFKWLIGIGLVVVLGVLAFAIFEPVQVLPRMRVAPGFALVDQSGDSYTSEDGRGAVTLYTFLPSGCDDDCATVNETMVQVGERVTSSVDLGEAEFRQVTIALDTDDPAALRGAAEDSGADGTQWRWIGGSDETLRDVVGAGFGVYFEQSDEGVRFDPVFIIVDGNGLVRGDYRYATLASDTDRLTRHISILGAELRNSSGANSLVYEAAHVFLCYP